MLQEPVNQFNEAILKAKARVVGAAIEPPRESRSLESVSHAVVANSQYDNACNVRRRQDLHGGRKRA